MSTLETTERCTCLEKAIQLPQKRLNIVFITSDERQLYVCNSIWI